MISKLKKLSIQTVMLTAAALLTANPSFALTKTLPDLVVANFQDDTVSTLINVVGKNFAKAGVDVASGDNPVFVSKADFNEDGLQDVVVVNVDGALTFMLGQGNGVFTPLPSSFSLGYSVSDTLAVADFNNDGHADILVSSQSSFVQVFLGDGNLSGNPASHFTAQSPVSFASRTNSVAVADFNKDGKMDAAVCDYNSQKVYILFGDGLGGLTAMQSLNAPPNTSDVATGDFNADGNADFAVAGGLGDYASVYLGQASGFFVQANEIQVHTRANGGLGAIAVAIADMNNDGYDDFVTMGGDSNPNDVVTVRLWNPAGNNFVAGGSVPAQGIWLAGLNIADLNADGNNDVVFVGQPTASVVVVHFGDGAGNLGPRNEFSAGNDPAATVIVDADPILHDYVTKIRFTNKADLVGDKSSFKKTETLYVTLEDTLINKNTSPSTAVVRVRVGLNVKQANFVARPDGTFVAAVNLNGLNAGTAVATVDFVAQLAGTPGLPDFIVHRKSNLTIVP